MYSNHVSFFGHTYVLVHKEKYAISDFFLPYNSFTSWYPNEREWWNHITTNNQIIENLNGKLLMLNFNSMQTSWMKKKQAEKIANK